MHTKFGKSIVASGMIAALGANLIGANPAFAGPDRHGDRRYEREDARTAGDKRKRHPAPAHAEYARPAGRTVERRAERPAKRVVHKQVVVQQPVIVKKTVVVERPRAPHRPVAYAAPIAKAGYGYRDYRDEWPHRGYAPPPTRVIVVPERRHYRDVWVVRHHGHRYHGYGHYLRDDDAYRWLALTAITVALINGLTEHQQRAYEDAQIRATTAPIGETIYWNHAGAQGTVTPTREGTSSSNRYCREFQKTVTIGGRTEQAYGTACMQPDGAWEVVSGNTD